MHREIEALKRKALTLGAMVEQAIAQAAAALIRNDPAQANQVVETDKAIDRMEIEVEEECLKILALYQPVAGDLRLVISILKMNNDLERMGDLARSIARSATRLAELAHIRPPADLADMAQRAQEMVKHSLDALVSADPVLAEQVIARDDELDRMRVDHHNRIVGQIREEPSNVESLLTLHSVVRHLERLGDIATNVAEDVIYMAKGEIVRHQSLHEPDEQE
jgi:phosphate transport system protein